MNDNTKVKIQPNAMAQVYSAGEYPAGWFSGDSVRPIGYGMEFHVPVLPKLVVERVHPDAVIPTYASEGDSGMDVYSPVDMLVRPQETVKIGIGFKLGIPRHPLHELGYRWEVQSRSRSGLNLKTELVVKPGTIDNFFTDEPGAIIKNDTQVSYEADVDRDEDTNNVRQVSMEVEQDSHVVDLQGVRVTYKDLSALGLMAYYESLPKGTLLIRKGDRIAQLVFNQIIRPLEIVEGKVDDSVSRGGGFGHSGVSLDSWDTSWDTPPMGAPKGW